MKKKLPLLPIALGLGGALGVLVAAMTLLAWSTGFAETYLLKLCAINPWYYANPIGALVGFIEWFTNGFLLGILLWWILNRRRKEAATES